MAMAPFPEICSMKKGGPRNIYHWSIVVVQGVGRDFNGLPSSSRRFEFLLGGGPPPQKKEQCSERMYTQHNISKQKEVGV